MVVQFQTSFAGRRSPVTASGLSGSRTVQVLEIISVILFSATVLLAGGVYLYRGYLLRSIETMNAQLVEARKSFEPEFVETASRLNSRIESGKTLLSLHVGISPIFDLLEKKTLEDVRFIDFAFRGFTERDMSVAMTGQAKSFNAVALQSDIFGAERYFKDPVFSNFTLNEKGEVIFNFKAAVTPEFLRYRENLLSATSSSPTGNDSFDTSAAPFDSDAE